MKIALFLNDQRINDRPISYLLKNFHEMTLYDLQIVGPLDIVELKDYPADGYLVYGEGQQVFTDLPTVVIPYCHYTDQPEDYVFLESHLKYTGMEISDHLPVLRYSINGKKIEGIRDKNQIKLNFDLLWNCFFHMSLFREYLYEEKYGDLGSYFNKLQIPAQVIEIPVVNCLFSMLENLMLSFLTVNQRVERRFEVLLTHDVDALSKTWLHRSKQTAFYGYNGLKNILTGEIKSGFLNLGQAVRHFFTSVKYANIAEIIESDRSFKVKSIFFIYSKKRQFLDWFKYWIYDPQYDISKKTTGNKLQVIKEQSIPTGLHAGFGSYKNYNRYQSELVQLTQGRGPIEWNRNHWLNYNVHYTFEILERAGIKYDSTLGFNDYPGFRSGLCLPYFPYNFKEEKAYEVREYPLNIMDGTLFNYLRLDNGQALMVSRNVKEWVRKFNGVLVLNWHNHVYSRDYNWHWILKDLLKEEKR